MKYYAIFLAGALMISATFKCYSQTKKFLYYFDVNLNSTEKENSVFTGIGTYENGLVKLNLYTTLNRKLVSIEHYTDSSLHISEGLSQTFFRNSFRESEGNYVKGKEEGLWKKWDSLGRIIDSSVYNNGEKIMQAHFTYYTDGPLDYFDIKDIKADRVQRTYYNDKGDVVKQADFTGNNGIVKYYNDGVITKTDTFFTRMEIEASFPGGDKAWNKYIDKQLQKNIYRLTNDGKSGICRVRFIIDEEGNVTDAEALTMKGSRLAELMVNSIMKGPKWIPANQFGKPVKAYREQPVTFTLESR